MCPNCGAIVVPTECEINPQESKDGWNQFAKAQGYLPSGYSP